MTNDLVNNIITFVLSVIQNHHGVRQISGKGFLFIDNLIISRL